MLYPRYNFCVCVCVFYDCSEREIDARLRALPKVQLLRNSQRQGLMRSRLRGAAAATAEVLVFLDSHVEPNEGWLPPLLDRIHADPQTVVAPTIDDVDYKSFQYKCVTLNQQGVFDWHLSFKWTPLSASQREAQRGAHRPFETPVHAGGLYAISRNWFERLGRYDPSMRLWG